MVDVIDELIHITLIARELIGENGAVILSERMRTVYVRPRE